MACRWSRINIEDSIHDGRAASTEHADNQTKCCL
jgi:hypothetical protein